MRAQIPLLPERVALAGGFLVTIALVVAFWKFATLSKGRK